MEPAQEPVGPRQGNVRQPLQVFRESGVIGGGEPPPVPPAEGANRQPDRPLRGEVDDVRRERTDQLGDAPAAGDGERNLGVERDRRAGEQAGLDHGRLVPAAAQVLDARLPRADHAVDLRPPGVGGE